MLISFAPKHNNKNKICCSKPAYLKRYLHSPCWKTAQVILGCIPSLWSFPVLCSVFYLTKLMLSRLLSKIWEYAGLFKNINICIMFYSCCLLKLFLQSWLGFFHFTHLFQIQEQNVTYIALTVFGSICFLMNRCFTSRLGKPTNAVHCCKIGRKAWFHHSNHNPWCKLLFGYIGTVVSLLSLFLLVTTVYPAPVIFLLK